MANKLDKVIYLTVVFMASAIVILTVYMVVIFRTSPCPDIKDFSLNQGYYPARCGHE